MDPHSPSPPRTLRFALAARIPRCCAFQFAAVHVEGVFCAALQGANAETGAKHTMPGGIPEEKRRHFRAINHVADIDGAVTGTLK
jgi:hypothetical protein